MRRRRRQEPARHACAVKGCPAIVAAWKRICDAHWKRLPFAHRQAIAKAGQDRAPHRVASLTVEAIAWLNRNAPDAIAARLTGERDA